MVLIVDRCEFIFRFLSLAELFDLLDQLIKLFKVVLFRAEKRIHRLFYSVFAAIATLSIY